MGAPRIIVEIDELVLHGFDPRERSRIGDAVQARLQALLAGVAPGAMAPRAVDRVDAGRFPLGAGDGAAAVGHRVARALYRSLV